jgi:Fic family protein
MIEFEATQDTDTSADTREDMKPACDNGEAVALMEPALLGSASELRRRANDLAVQLAAESAAFRRGLPEAIQAPLADLVRGMNCYYVKVGLHVPVSPGALERFLERFERAYRDLGIADTIIGAAAAHHRLLWIRPFLDGNGRVAPLMSHAQLLEALDTGALWSIARGLARNVERYRAHLIACDAPRWNDLDGRGHLSERALGEFTEFFLETCLDQVRFMESLVQPARLRSRIQQWVELEVRNGTLPAQAAAIMDSVLFRGELPRGDVAGVVQATSRHARRIAGALLKHGALTSETERSPLRLAFPARLGPLWMPGLFPEPPAATK